MTHTVAERFAWTGDDIEVTKFGPGKKDWNEEAHPRDDHGRFGEGNNTVEEGRTEVTLNNHWDLRHEQESRLTAKQNTALENYGSEDYDPINWGLRHSGTVGIEDQVAVLDAAFERGSIVLANDVTVYRSIDNGDQVELWVGKDFTDAAYVSTSLIQNTAEGFGGLSPDMMTMRIELPAGSRVLLGTDTEQEILLPRGSSFEVESRDGQDIVNMRYLW